MRSIALDGLAADVGKDFSQAASADESSTLSP